MVVQHNMQAMNANRMLNVTTGQQAKSTEKLSSGYKINRAADDAAGLTISEKMRKQIRGLDQASTNAQDGVSSVQTAEGALTEVHSMLQRMNELAVQASNGTNSEDDRQAIQDEISQLTTEIDRVAETTKFNEIYLLKGDKSGTTKTNTLAAHDAGLAGKLSESVDGKTTFTADALKVGSSVKIAGTEYKIVGSAKATDYTDLKGYTANADDKIIRADQTYTYDGAATAWKDEAGNTVANFAATAGDTLVRGGAATTIMGDKANNYTASTMDAVKTAITALAADAKVSINGKEYTVKTTTDLTKANPEATADDIAALVKEGDLLKVGNDFHFVLPAAAKNENEISLNDAYAKMADELGKASSIGADKAATVKNNGDGTFEITQGTVNVKKSLSFSLHVGADADATNKINVNIEAMSAAGLGIKGLSVKDDSGVAATYAIDAIADAVAKVSSQRSALGAVQNRLEHTIDNLDNVVENTTSAESRIRDTDMAEEMVNYSKNNILAQAGQSMLAQANQSTQGVLSLLQ
ncbi:flagellin N-terminal helical domain-containing protein [Roseburia inulinivorans]